MPAKAVDASVLAASAFQEPRAEEALSLMDGSELYAPRLLAYDLTSIARKKAQQYPQQRGSLIELLEAALASEINWVDVSHRVVYSLALETGLSTYDASYLQVALSRGMPW